LIFFFCQLNLNDHLNENLSNIGIELKKQNILTLVPPGEKAKKVVPKSENIQPKMITNDADKQQSIAVETEMSSDDDLALGASASPTEEPSSSPPALPALFDTPPEKPTSFRRCNDFPSKSQFVGLVNQARQNRFPSNCRNFS
jgi:hypothetical protein